MAQDVLVRVPVREQGQGFVLLILKRFVTDIMQRKLFQRHHVVSTVRMHSA